MMLKYRSASPGYWVACLLPTALFLSGPSSQFLICFGTITINTIIISILHSRETDLTVLLGRARNGYLLLAITLFAAIIILCQPGNPYVLFTDIALGYSFPYLFYNLVKYYPRSFTFGEAMIVTQAFITMFWHSVRTIPNPVFSMSMENPQIILLFSEAGFLGVMILIRILVIAIKPWTFHFSEEFFSLWGKCCLGALGYHLSVKNAWDLIFWLGNFLMERISLFTYCALCLVSSFGVVYLKNLSEQSASTADRKYFHFLVVAVFLPGIILDREFIFLGSAAAIYVLILVEAIRSLGLTFFGAKIGEEIDKSMTIFRDQQDEGKLLLTPLYLMAGCSLPIWLLGLDKSFSRQNDFELAACLAGIMSIGIGDTFASIGGSMLETVRWKGTNKSLGGTACCFGSQLIFIWFLRNMHLCCIPWTVMGALILAAFINSLVEALTDQIDNLVLPLLTYDLILVSSVVLKLWE